MSAEVEITTLPFIAAADIDPDNDYTTLVDVSTTPDTMKRVTITDIRGLVMGAPIGGGGASRLLYEDGSEELASCSKVIVAGDEVPTNKGTVGVYSGVFLMPDGSTTTNIEFGPWLGGLLQDLTAWPDTKMFLFGPSGEPDFTWKNGGTVHGSAPLWPSGIPDTVFGIGTQVPSVNTRLLVCGQSDDSTTYALVVDNYSKTFSQLAITSNGQVFWNGTITPGGTTGPRTINKYCGTVNATAADAAGLTVTNDHCVVGAGLAKAWVMTTGTSTVIESVVSGNGNFVIHFSTPPASECIIGWEVINVI